MTAILHDLAARLDAAAQARAPIPPIKAEIPNADAAYDIQQVNTARRLGAGRRLVGRKIGLTSPAVQRQLGVDQPDYGMLFDDMAVPDGWDVAADRLIQPKVEAEVAFVLGRDLDDERLTVADLLRAIDFALPAIEIVDSRIADWKISFLDTVADNASSGLYVLGTTPRRLGDLDLRAAKMVLTEGERQVSAGIGAACLGHPLNATLWLASTMARLGRPLRAGDTILSGALGPMATVGRGRTYEAQIEGLGTVRAAFAADKDA
ncbi:2-keto-4-pentenoate hydratase [Zavarzinia compransoris]|uniref:2-keto-4-pentenoate hydratase n=1 Tax=Zavarzinia compransoris TaxID=1264899 RepID=A0A317E1N3_9PROT|nr:fumarylacetoacetate hydrolase family protein [Zavarzinia compransoris]PWR20968.1 2-keto-4-pentenoate hydratase [Zavarzinia compransoris]TDP43996.1 2-keto-4-pentenoate hydratase [Zavarzinia compransoris]